MTDFLSGAIWTLLCILIGCLIALVFVAVLGDRGDPGPEDDEPPIDPTPDELEAWLNDHTTTPPFEANLLRGER